jgi:hypothetical protein
MSRYRSDEATVWVWDDYDRTCLKWRSSDHWDEIRQSLKAYFPRHGDLSYSPSRKLWSVPLWRRLGMWGCEALVILTGESRRWASAGARSVAKVDHRVDQRLRSRGPSRLANDPDGSGGRAPASDSPLDDE